MLDSEAHSDNQHKPGKAISATNNTAAGTAYLNADSVSGVKCDDASLANTNSPIVDGCLDAGEQPEGNPSAQNLSCRFSDVRLLLSACRTGGHLAIVRLDFRRSLAACK